MFQRSKRWLNNTLNLAIQVAYIYLRVRSTAPLHISSRLHLFLWDRLLLFQPTIRTRIFQASHRIYFCAYNVLQKSIRILSKTFRSWFEQNFLKSLQVFYCRHLEN